MTIKNIKLQDYIAERMAEDPEFAEGFRAEVNKRELARVLRELREAAGMSQVALAEASRTTQSAIARIEGGKTLPKIDVVARLVDALGGTWHSEFRLANGTAVTLHVNAPAPIEPATRRDEPTAPPGAARRAAPRAARGAASRAGR